MIDLKAACRGMIDVLAGTAAEQLANPTPCTDFDVRALIGHIDAGAVGFAAVARKELESAVDGLGDDWRETTSIHVRELAEAWADPQAWQGVAPDTGLDLPNELWGKIALTEMVVHGWDLARATGQFYVTSDETLRACYDHVVDFIPNAPIPSLWGTPVEVAADAPLLDHIVATTGRTP